MKVAELVETSIETSPDFVAVEMTSRTAGYLG
jgi:hypothetical protein